jgi:glyoxylase-like metal-dependent hydrolase (beta-lactamase superfamily II)
LAGRELTGALSFARSDVAVPDLHDWTAVPVPGHTLGSVALFRPADRVLLTGDAVLTACIGGP